MREGRLSLKEELPVSQHAMNYGGSTLFLRAGERVSVEDLLRGIIVLSGNDACAVIAEALSPDGTEAGFAQLMTRRARQIGMENSTFSNSNGWPDPGQRMSMRDLAVLANRLHLDFPDFYPMFAEKEFLFDEKESQNRYNRNPLLGLGIGADGLKTGAHIRSRVWSRWLCQTGRPSRLLCHHRPADGQISRRRSRGHRELGLPSIHPQDPCAVWRYRV